MESLLKNPEKKITNASKLLNKISTNFDKKTNKLKENLPRIRNLESTSDSLILKILEDRKKQEQKQSQVESKTKIAPPPTAEEDVGKTSFAAGIAAAMATAAVSSEIPSDQTGTTSVTPMISEGGIVPTSADIFPRGVYDPTGSILGRGRPHKGIDISSANFRPGMYFSVIYPGVVQDVAFDGRGFGNYVIIKHKNDLYSLYGHLDKVLVKKGDLVAQNGESTVIGTIGTTGRSTGPHIHFELGRGYTPSILKDHFDPMPHVQNFIRGGGRVKVRQQSNTSVSPPSRQRSTPEQLRSQTPKDQQSKINNTITQPISLAAGINQNQIVSSVGKFDSEREKIKTMLTLDLANKVV